MAEKNKIKANVSKKKIETVKEIVSLINSSETLILASIKNLPSRQFQDIRKNLRNKAKVMVVKKRIMLKAIENSDKKIGGLKEHVCEDSAALFSKEDPFDLAEFLSENKNPIGAKAGQIAVEDIKVEEGLTEIMPGPAISDFSSLGIPIAVENGKIAIKQSKAIVKAGEKISESAASLMLKLDIMPFKIGLDPIALCEIKTGKIYTGIKIDKEATLTELKTAAAKSLGFAQKIAYYCKETIGYLLAKANTNAKALGKLHPENESNTQETKPEEQ